MIRSFSILLLTLGVLAPSVGAQTTSSLVVFPVVSPKISSLFGKRNHPVLGNQLHHGGIDLAAPEKSHVRVVLDGQVVFAGRYAGYGKLITVEHSSGRTTLYGHLSEISVNVGQRISAGEVIGRVGSTGISTGPHLHFEWRENGQVVNPLEVFPNLKVRPRG
jgi:murein DD-endopeptidase MepM/ murein hydrolase activator NlpD